MSASLVGSEMCIRDRLFPFKRMLEKRSEARRAAVGRCTPSRAPLARSRHSAPCAVAVGAVFVLLL
eukprot:10862712-Alexandrium_andersonii.AAC.1